MTSGVSLEAVSPRRHIERSLAVAFWVGVTVAATAPPLTSFFWPLSIALLAQLGVSAATLSADADLKRGPDHGWDAHGPALVGVLAAYAVLGPMGAFLVDTTVVTENATVLAMVRWAHAAGCCKSQRSCGGVSWLLLFSSGVFHCLMASLLAAGACALSGVAVPAWVVVLLLVALAVLVRLTGHMRAVTAITALDEALTSEVADAVMTRAIQDSGPPVRNTANITGETGAGAAVRGTIEEESRRIKPGDSLAKASSQRKLAGV